MSLPILPNFTPTISITIEQTIPLLLASIALEELALAHIINVQAEELQSVLGTLPGGTPISPPFITLADLLAMNSSVQRTLRHVIKKEMLLEFKFENVLDLLATVPPPPPTPIVTVTLKATPTTICTLGTGPFESVLTGTVLVNGSPPPVGTPVFFTVIPAGLGSVALNPAITDALGNFTAIFGSTDGPTVPPGVTITATALGASSNTVTVNIVNCSVLTSFTFGPNGNTICSMGTGTNTITLSGQVLVDGGVPVAGIPVSFIVAPAALGTVSPTSTTTDASGNFSTFFTAINGGPSANVIATLPTFGATLLVAINIIDCP
ncbi:Ig-like domain-containing protein [Peribacillus butanolivorans]|uniref:hypothetical protein n=1 Tax=Peribacillus butanolivorans TaxID=421767 RepID=UPI0036DBFF79